MGSGQGYSGWQQLSCQWPWWGVSTGANGDVSFKLSLWHKHDCDLTVNFHRPAFSLHFLFHFVSNPLLTHSFQYLLKWVYEQQSVKSHSYVIFLALKAELAKPLGYKGQKLNFS